MSTAASRLAADASSTNATTFSTMPNIERARRDDLTLRERPRERAPHELVAVALDPAVDGVGAAGGHRAADDDREHRAERRDSPARARNIGGTAVTSSSSITRGFVSRRYAPNVAASGRGLERERRAGTVGDDRRVIATTTLPFMPCAA